MNSEWIQYERGAREHAEAVRHSEDPDVRAAIDAVNARKRELANQEAAALAAQLADSAD